MRFNLRGRDAETFGAPVRHYIEMGTTGVSTARAERCHEHEEASVCALDETETAKVPLGARRS